MNTCSTSCLWQVCLCCMYRDYNKMVFQKVIYLWLKWRDGDQISSIALNNQKADQIYESLGFKSLDISQWRRVLLEEGNNWPLGLPSLTVLRHRKGKKNPGGYWWTLWFEETELTITMFLKHPENPGGYHPGTKVLIVLYTFILYLGFPQIVLLDTSLQFLFCNNGDNNSNYHMGMLKSKWIKRYKTHRIQPG